MSLTTSRIAVLILDQLASREMRLLSLTVAIRKGLDVSQPIKGDLSSIVTSSLRRLIAANAVTETEGLYTLAAPAALTAAK